MQANQTLPATQANPRILIDESIPFDDYKVQVLENVVNVMYGGSGMNVRYRKLLIILEISGK